MTSTPQDASPPDDIEAPPSDHENDDVDALPPPPPEEEYDVPAEKPKRAQSGTSADSEESRPSLMVTAPPNNDASDVTPTREPRKERQKSTVAWVLSAPASSDQKEKTEENIPRVQVSRGVYEVQQALRYRMLMRPRQVPPSDVEKAHVISLLLAFFTAQGFHKTSTALRNKEEVNELLQGYAADAATTVAARYPVDLVDALMDAARKTSLLYDDDNPWSSENLFHKQFPLAVVNESKKIQGSTVNYLVEKLVLEQQDTPFGDSQCEPHFTNVFLLMYSRFLTPDALVSKLCKLFKTVSSQGPLFGEPRRVALQKRILDLLTAWVRVAAVDCPRVVLERIASFSVGTQQCQGHHSDVVNASQQLNAQAQKILSEEESVSWCPFPALPAVVVAADVPSPDLPSGVVRHIKDVGEVEVARQLCLYHFALFKKVRVRDFFHSAWDASDMSACSTSLLDVVHQFDKTACWVASMILSPSDLAERRAMYIRCIHIAKHLYDMQNYYIATAFLTGIDHPSVQQMPQTVMKQAFTANDMDILDGLKAALFLGGSASKHIPATLTTPSIPNVTYICGEICRSEQYAETWFPNPNAGGAPLLNWSKMQTLGKVLLRFVAFQSIPYPYHSIPVVQQLVAQMPGKRNVEALYLLSKDREGNRAAAPITAASLS